MPCQKAHTAIYFHKHGYYVSLVSAPSPLVLSDAVCAMVLYLRHMKPLQDCSPAHLDRWPKPAYTLSWCWKMALLSEAIRVLLFLQLKNDSPFVVVTDKDKPVSPSTLCYSTTTKSWLMRVFTVCWLCIKCYPSAFYTKPTLAYSRPPLWMLTWAARLRSLPALHSGIQNRVGSGQASSSPGLFINTQHYTHKLCHQLGV